MPTLNAGALLENCLASVAAQTWPADRLEIIIADAFSQDHTRDIARREGPTAPMAGCHRPRGTLRTCRSSILNNTQGQPEGESHAYQRP